MVVEMVLTKVATMADWSVVQMVELRAERKEDSTVVSTANQLVEN